MPQVKVASTSPLLQRTCLCCGFRGEELQRSGERAAYRCPSCGQDLYARPARSYVEMEGLQVQPAPVPSAAPPKGNESRADKASRRGLLRRLVMIVLGRLGLRRPRRKRRVPGPHVRPRATTTRH